MMNNNDKTFTYWLNHQPENYGLCDPPIDPQLAIQFLIKYLLGENWYAPISESINQINCVAVHEILYKYSKKYRKERKRFIKKYKKIKKKGGIYYNDII